MIRWERKFNRVVSALALAMAVAAPAYAKGGDRDHKKLDKTLTARAGKSGTSRVIVVLRPGQELSGGDVKKAAKLGRKLRLVSGQVVEIPNALLHKLAERSEVLSVHHDRPTGGEMNRTAVVVGARAVQAEYGYGGEGVGVAVIDSGITNYHDDLTYGGSSPAVRVKNGQRVTAFVDFVNGRTAKYDDNGHGTHVAGIIAGNGLDTFGARAGIAPAAHLVSLKVLDDHGRGVISNVIAALDWVIANKAAHNIRVVNLSVGAAVTESYQTDPLTLAAKRAVDAGIVVVTAAGNLGKNSRGELQYGGITAPGNAPWVLTVGAYSHNGTLSRQDDTMAGYSSRGPSAVDFEAKPDIVAPGTGTVSLSDPLSLLYITKADYLVKGTLFSAVKPYLSLTGTSMAAPVVSGTVALMVQANPSLTPNLVKAILQYTAQEYSSYNALTQGAGFVNTRGAVQLARFFRTARAGSRLSMPHAWSKKINWGSHRISGGVIRPNANAFLTSTTWGAATDAEGDNIVWGTLFGRDVDNIVWGTASEEDNLTWGNSGEDAPLFDDPNGEPVNYDHTIWENIFPVESVAVVDTVESSVVEAVDPVLAPVTFTISSTGLLGGGF